ncbi:MAG: DUF1775 domain-containing protein [Candidatus Saccharimonadia bacterium]
MLRHTGLAGLIALLFLPGIASAHVIVTPSAATVAQELVFSISVPNERNTPVSEIRLDIPNGVTSVLPTSNIGWNITTKTDQQGNISEIDWKGGQIPVGERLDFSFGAQVPAVAGVLDWKAYQTYADGTVISWDQKPAGSDDSTGVLGPYSTTSVINTVSHTSFNLAYFTLVIAVLGVLLGLVAIWRSR